MVPFRLLLDKGDPIALITVNSGLYGVVWALMTLAIDWGQRIRAKAAGSIHSRAAATTAERRAWARRGAIVGLGVGVPFYRAARRVRSAAGGIAYRTRRWD